MKTTSEFILLRQVEEPHRCWKIFDILIDNDFLNHEHLTHWLTGYIGLEPDNRDNLIYSSNPICGVFVCLPSKPKSLASRCLLSIHSNFLTNPLVFFQITHQTTPRQSSLLVFPNYVFRASKTTRLRDLNYAWLVEQLGKFFFMFSSTFVYNLVLHLYRPVFKHPELFKKT